MAVRNCKTEIICSPLLALIITVLLMVAFT